MSEVIQSKSKINYSYSTIKITQSRIDKGLIAIPVSLAEWFPEHNATIQVSLDDSDVLQTKNYASYRSATRECRIGGMAEWFNKNKIKDGNEIVVQLVDKENFIYKLIPEHKFLLKTQELQKSFDASEDETEASEQIIKLSQWTDLDEQKVAFNEYRRLIDTVKVEERRSVKRPSSRARESVPYNLRVLLGNIYQGHCQVCDFWFLKQDNNPYFETHHTDPSLGSNPKNIILVCANCHRQFEYANVHPDRNKEGWLIMVSFNERTYSVNQVVLKTAFEDFFKKLFV